MAENAHCHPSKANVQEPPVHPFADVPADWLRPDWPAPARVHALCTTRSGGVSREGFASMNLGSHVGDDPEAVAHNRSLLAAALQGITPGARPVFLEQVHGKDCVQLVRGSAHGTRFDAAVAMEPGLVCTIMVADCLPVLMTDRAGAAVAAAHAGWRGLADGVLESMFERFKLLALNGIAQEAMKNIAYQREQFRSSEEILVWLGPCIGAQAFEVGASVREAFCLADAQAASCFVPIGQGKYRANLAGLARQRLARLGITQIYGNDGSDEWCTVRNPLRFFSHRRDGAAVQGSAVGGTGRMAACIWLG